MSKSAIPTLPSEVVRPVVTLTENRPPRRSVKYEVGATTTAAALLCGFTAATWAVLLTVAVPFSSDADEVGTHRPSSDSRPSRERVDLACVAGFPLVFFQTARNMISSRAQGGTCPPIRV